MLLKVFHFITLYVEKKRALPYNPDLKQKQWHTQFVNTSHNVYRMSP
jgi:hypothetical protein